MLIFKLDNKDKKMANSILNVQLPAYMVEAKLINFEGIPQLKDNVESIRESKEIFIGYVIENDLKGFLAYSEDENEYQICRLVVHPSYFKRGIASKLVDYFLNEIAKKKKIIVSTGSENLPAINLYKSFGFKFQKSIEVAPNFFISLFENKFN
ncbi:GNAT family N-acetyltransferase [Bacillus sp. AFS055030]|uniref:GNAT family N-acetyltransferase n=1 Tax=Bacillus sp. AFS055030 TaxID=2033507 RepID=UPI000BFBD8AF|nr:GNAT family N-acetyltransferase [Bacillus sp. AFS055030]PGL70576.1 GNAT family N-acetyltransferase [Bacillus sp. AFS055030]